MSLDFILDRSALQSKLDELIEHARCLESAGQLGQAIQAYDTLLQLRSGPDTHAGANLRLGKIYHEWDELFTAQRFLGYAHQSNPANAEAKAELIELNEYIAQNQEAVIEENARKNSDSIVSLFRVATGLKLLRMDKPVQAYPLMKSRTKIYPNAAVAKHLLTDVIITAEEKNAAIEFLEEGKWLINTQQDFYSITPTGLYTFYMELAKLHMANGAYDEAADCYEQAYWLDNSQPTPLYRKVICHAQSQSWDKGLATLERTTGDPPEAIEKEDYYASVAHIFAATYESTQDRTIGLRAVQACEAVLAINKRNRAISRLRKSLRSILRKSA